MEGKQAFKSSDQTTDSCPSDGYVKVKAYHNSKQQSLQIRRPLTSILHIQMLQKQQKQPLKRPLKRKRKRRLVPIMPLHQRQSSTDTHPFRVYSQDELNSIGDWIADMPAHSCPIFVQEHCFDDW